MKRILITIASVAALLFATGCEAQSDPTGNGQQTETKTTQSNYDKLVQNQPAHTGNYSPTRATKNFWIDTWMKAPGKTSYVYLFSNTGTVVAYMVFEGLPVNYCTSLVPPTVVKTYDGGTDGASNPIAVPNPSIDGTFSSGGGCDTFYGKSATTGAYVQYTAGMGLNPLLYDQPLTPDIVGNAPNLTATK